MYLREFYQGISLAPKAIQALEEFQAREWVEVSYERHKKLFYENQEQYFQELRELPDGRLWFLYEYCRMACEVWEKYQQEGIGESIYWDTFSDIRIWCENCVTQYGTYGLAQYDWLFRHIKMTLFRLGRLQFEIPGEMELSSIPKSWSEKEKDPERDLLFVHIPQGEPLLLDSCKNSFSQAEKFFGKGKKCPIFLCHSWLLGEHLKKLLSSDSNIMEFQKLFQIVEQDYETREAEERIFGQTREYPEEYPENTSLQVRAKEFLLKGGQLGNGFGVIL